MSTDNEIPSTTPKNEDTGLWSSLWAALIILFAQGAGR